LGRKIVKLRMERGMTQERLAESAEISHRYLQSLEAGQKEPSISVVVRLRKALECAWDDLLDGL
jgi:transcriptional regulator with XRE-family HTH domain